MFNLSQNMFQDPKKEGDATIRGGTFFVEQYTVGRALQLHTNKDNLFLSLCVLRY